MTDKKTRDYAYIHLTRTPGPKNLNINSTALKPFIQQTKYEFTLDSVLSLIFSPAGQQSGWPEAAGDWTLAAVAAAGG